MTKISDAPLIATVTGSEQMPTGEAGDKAVSIDQIKDYAVAGKQDTLVSGTNIKTINGSSVLGSGDLSVSGGHEIQDNGTPMATEPALNFIGFTLTDNPGNSSTDIELTLPNIEDKVATATVDTSPVDGDYVLSFDSGLGIILRTTLLNFWTNYIKPKADAVYEPLITVLSIAKGGTNSNAALSNSRVMKSSGGAIVEAAAITASRALKSDVNGIPVHFDTATEPSLTELSYVKGVTSAIQTQLNSNLTDSYYDRNAVAISAGTLTLDISSKRLKNFDLTSTVSSGFTIAFSNSTNIVEVTLSMRVTGSVAITMPSAVVMNNYEETNERWNASTNVLTIVGVTASPFIIKFYSDGTNVWAFATENGV